MFFQIEDDFIDVNHNALQKHSLTNYYFQFSEYLVPISVGVTLTILFDARIGFMSTASILVGLMMTKY